MKFRIPVVVPSLLIIFCLFYAVPLWGATDNLDEAFDKAVSYQIGQSRQGLAVIENAIKDSYASPDVRNELAQRLAKLLGMQQGSWACKDFACRQLSLIGSSQEVPALAGLLGDPKLSDIARYALQRIADPAALAALRQALSKENNDDIKIGIINSLGELGDKEAALLMAEPIKSGNQAQAAAAIIALGKIGGKDAFAVLETATSSFSDEQLALLDQAFLNSANRALERGGDQLAARIYQKVYNATKSPDIRAAAFGGLIASLEPDKAAALVVKSLKSEHPQMQSLALRFIRNLKGPVAAGTLAEELPNFSPANRAMVLVFLGELGESIARPAVLKTIEDPDEAIRLAGLQALAKLGNAADVVMLAKLAAAQTGPIRDAARNSLDRISGPEVDAAIMAALEDAHHTDAKERVELLRSLGSRHTVAAATLLVKNAGQEDQAVRLAAVEALGKVASGDNLPDMIKLLKNAPTTSDSKAVEKAITTVYSCLPDENQSIDVLTTACPDAGPAAKAAILRILGNIGSSQAITVVRSALKEPDENLQDEAVRVLAGWPNTAATDDLLNIIKNNQKMNLQILALRGYIRLAGLKGENQGEQLEMYKIAWQLAQRTEEKKLILSGLSQLASESALEMVKPYLGDDELKAEAQEAAKKIQSRLDKVKNN